MDHSNNHAFTNKTDANEIFQHQNLWSDGFQ